MRVREPIGFHHRKSAGKTGFRICPTFPRNDKNQRGIGLKELYFPDLSGKTVLIYLGNRTSEESVVLEDVSFQIQGDKIVMVGRIAEGTTPNDWASGITTAVSWDGIEQYLVFDSLQEYLDRVARSYTDENFH